MGNITEDKSSPSYWEDLFNKATPAEKICLEGLDIPCDKKNLNTNEYKTKKINISVMLPKLQSITKNHKIPIDTIMHAAWSILLHRYTDCAEVIYGMGDCVDVELNNLVIRKNPLPIKTTTTHNPTSLQFLISLNETLKRHVENKNSYHNEIFNSSQSCMRYLVIQVSRKDKSSTDENIVVINPQQYPLILCINIKKSSEIEFFYNTKLYSDSSIENIAIHFMTILSALSKQLLDNITQLLILSEEEYNNLLSRWNKNVNSVEHNKKQCVHDLFSYQASLHANNLAITQEDYSLTYQELDKLTNQLGRLLQQNDITPGDKIAVLMERNCQSIVAMLAIFKIGAIYIPINPKYPKERINFILHDCHEKMILTDEINKVPESLRYKIFHFNNPVYLNSIDDKVLSSIVSSEEIAYIAYTSGVTGRPKGVQINHLSLINLISWYQTNYDITANDKSVQFSSLSYDNYFSETLPFLATGASVHVINDSEKFIPKLLIAWLQREKITFCELPTAYAKILLKKIWSSKEMRIIKLHGDKLTKMIAGQYSFDIWNSYGVTEATIESTCIKIYEANSNISIKTISNTSSIGKPISNVEVYVVDEYLQPVPICVPGELLIGGAGLSIGYLNDEELTSEKFILNPFKKDSSEKLFKTGDLVRWRNDGNLDFLGKLTDRIKIEGVRIELNEIEKELSEYSDVSEAVVISKELHNGSKSLIAYLVPNLDKIRIPYQEECLLSLGEGKFFDLMTDDISKFGVAISGLTETITTPKNIRLFLALPGISQKKWLPGQIVWQQGLRAGIQFDLNTEQKSILDKSIKYYLSTHNLMNVLQSVMVKRNLHSAIRKKLPSHMTPTFLTVLPKFSLTFNGKIDWKSLPPQHDYKLLLDKNITAPTQLEKKLCSMWCDILHIDKASVNDNFFSIGGNSLLAARFLVNVLNEFSISIPVKIFLNLPFISNLAEYISSNGTMFHHHTLIQDQISHDMSLAEDLSPTKNAHDRIQGILLTGATQFLGAHILNELLNQTTIKIYCIVNIGKSKSAAIHFSKSIESYKLSKEVAISNRRITILEGDPSKHMLGLSSDQYKSLTNKIDVIYHCDADHNLMAPYSSLRARNVLSTKEIIKFATKKVNKRIVYISSLLGVNKSLTGEKLREEFQTDTDCSSLAGGFPQTCWVSEHLLTQSNDRGLAVTIYRCKNIGGQSNSGLTDTNNSLLLFIKGCVELGYAPNLNEKINFLPVDFVSKSIVGITLFQPEKNIVYHLENTYGIMWSDLIKWLSKNYYPIQFCSSQEWEMKIIDAGESNAFFPLLPLYLSKEEDADNQQPSLTHTVRALEKLEVDFPKIDEKLLNTYINYLVKIKFLPVRSKQRSTS